MTRKRRSRGAGRPSTPEPDLEQSLPRMQADLGRLAVAMVGREEADVRHEDKQSGVTVVVGGTGELRSVHISPMAKNTLGEAALDGSALGKAVLEAICAARAAAAEQLRAAAEKAGARVPEPGEITFAGGELARTAQAYLTGGGSNRAAAGGKAQGSRGAVEPAPAGIFAELEQALGALHDSAFTSPPESAGISATVGFGGDLRELAVSAERRRELDNLTLGERIVQAVRCAERAAEQARTAAVGRIAVSEADADQPPPNLHAILRQAAADHAEDGSQGAARSAERPW